MDLDLIALQPIDLSSPYLLGWESVKEVNGAILRLPRARSSVRSGHAARFTPTGFIRSRAT